MMFIGYTKDHEQEIINFYDSLSEKDKKRYAGIEAKKYGYGGISYIVSVFGCSEKTVRKGISELQNEAALNLTGIREKGDGRKKFIDTHLGINNVFNEVLNDYTAGDPMNDKVKWTNLSWSEISD